MKGETLAPNDFSAFFREVHGVEPFPWQRRLAQQVCETGWPDALDLPTSTGKTAAIDVAVFHLAYELSRKNGPRRASTRIAFVVDRRLVVDSATERAEAIAEALANKAGPVTARMAAALATVAETGARPLAVARLRGGIPKEPDWVRTPSQPVVLVSTVDQVGSRLLFRGYGVSRSMAPVHAGLLGEDALWLLDEAHLSQPLVETLRRIVDHQERRETAQPLRFVSLSATQIGASVSLLNDEDRRHDQLQRRLKAEKPAELLEIKGTDAEFEDAFVTAALGFSVAGGGSSRVVAVVVNRVARARHIAEQLEKHFAASQGTEPGADVALLIGRTRDLDRDAVLAELLPRMRANQREEGRPLFVVATQCVEAGADLDFDALVTEVAPLDALRQRFGRLNRLGSRPESQAAILAWGEQLGARAKPDPLYGEALRTTWALLCDKAESAGRGKAAKRTIDFGIDAAEDWLPPLAERSAYLPPRETAPILLDLHLDRLSMTSPPPVDDPEVGLYLHGPSSGPADVQIVWRADFDPREEDLAIERVAVCPPSSLEAVAVPYAEARRWFAGRASGDIADLVASPQEPESGGGRDRIPHVLRWRGSNDDATKIVPSQTIRPGDLIVVPAQLGGVDRWGWAPTSKSRVADLGEEANRKQREQEILRLSAALLTAPAPAEDEEQQDRRQAAWRALLGVIQDASDVEVMEAVTESALVPSSWRERIPRGGLRVVRSEDGLPLALVGKSEAPLPSTETDDGSVSHRAIRLDAHSAGVEEQARTLALAAGYDEKRAEDIALAAFLHDSGKAEPAFQRWLWGGDEIGQLAGPLLAKSGLLRLGGRARERSGLARHARHEIASVYFALAHPKVAEARDPELVLYLVGTHHGWGRPFFPAVAWPPPGSRFEADLGDGERSSAEVRPLAELQADWFCLRETLHARYGIWGLARMEAVLRLADHRRSQAEQRGESNGKA